MKKSELLKIIREQVKSTIGVQGAPTPAEEGFLKKFVKAFFGATASPDTLPDHLERIRMKDPELYLRLLSNLASQASAGTGGAEEPMGEGSPINKIQQMVKEELEVILTNEEVNEIFDLDVGALLDEMMSEEAELDEEKDDRWMQKAVNPKHKGYCTPMTKKTCTPKRKALAKRFKKAGRKKEKKGGTGWQGKV